MLTRLKVRGFKNLVDVDVRFGPFTCIAGANGVGKSNLLDAISFLAALADKPLMQAAMSVRDETGKTGDVRSLFQKLGDAFEDRMYFEAEMIVPGEGTDELGQTARATCTFLRYSVELGFRKENGYSAYDSLRLLAERLEPIAKRSAARHLRFPHDARKWRASAVVDRTTAGTAPFISTDDQGAVIQADGRGRQPRSLSAASLPRTVLSTSTAVEVPTAALARIEMRSWRTLQLEPAALRQPDAFIAPSELAANGSHLPATLYRMAHAHSRGSNGNPNDQWEAHVFARVANRLASLINDVRDVTIDRDESRETFTLRVRHLDGTTHSARALSDGTLRFLALAIIESDPKATGLLCLEEPENGVHPARIPAMLELLREIAMDVEGPIGEDNPLRQVIFNTHSPVVVGEVNDADILLAELREGIRPDRRRFRKLAFRCLPDTWRAATGELEIVPKGTLLQYLRPFLFLDLPKRGPRRRVVDTYVHGSRS
jgi:predicted ATPase